MALSRTLVENDGSSTSHTPTIHDTNTCVKLTMIVTDLSFSERIAIANLSYNISRPPPPCSLCESERGRVHDDRGNPLSVGNGTHGSSR